MLAAAAAASVLSGKDRTVTVPPPPGANWCRDRWFHDRLLMYSLPPGHVEYSLYSWDGAALESRKTLDLPGAAFHVLAGAASPDGACWFAGRFWSGSANQGAGVAVVIPGKLPEVFPMGSFVPVALAPSLDSSRVLLFGSEPGPARDGFTVRVLDRTGRQVLAAVAGTAWRMKSDPAAVGPFGAAVAIWNSQIPLVYHPAAGMLAEIDLHDNEVHLRRTQMPQQFAQRPLDLFELVQLRSGHLLGNFAERHKEQRRIVSHYLSLAPGGSEWISAARVPMQENGFGGLFGSSGDAIIRRKGASEYRKFSVESL